MKLPRVTSTILFSHSLTFIKFLKVSMFQSRIVQIDIFWLSIYHSYNFFIIFQYTAAITWATKNFVCTLRFMNAPYTRSYKSKINVGCCSILWADWYLMWFGMFSCIYINDHWLLEQLTIPGSSVVFMGSFIVIT